MRPRETQIRIHLCPTRENRHDRSLYHSVFIPDAVLSLTARPAANSQPAEE